MFGMLGDLTDGADAYSNEKSVVGSLVTHKVPSFFFFFFLFSLFSFGTPMPASVTCEALAYPLNLFLSDV